MSSAAAAADPSRAYACNGRCAQLSVEVEELRVELGQSSRELTACAGSLDECRRERGEALDRLTAYIVNEVDTTCLAAATDLLRDIMENEWCVRPEWARKIESLLASQPVQTLLRRSDHAHAVLEAARKVLESYEDHDAYPDPEELPEEYALCNAAKELRAAWVDDELARREAKK
jgi:hypothetical protein